MTQEFKHLRNDGFQAKYGEWKEIQKGKPTTGENWKELFKEEDDYWERKAYRFTEYPKPIIKDYVKVLDAILDAPKLIRSGINEFKNNRNYLDVE